MGELLVDRNSAVKATTKTDQWVQPANTVRLVALWVCARTAADMQDGDAVAPSWDPLLEANPKDGRWRGLKRKRTVSDSLAPSDDNRCRKAYEAISSIGRRIVNGVIRRCRKRRLLLRCCRRDQ